MKRPRAHEIEEESEVIFKSFLPVEWIVRKIPKDYGVDYEVEIVENGAVTGKRFWLQLKGKESITIKHTQSSVRKVDPTNYVAFSTDTKLLKYSLHCDFPLLLGVVDVQQKEGFWLPLRDEIEMNLEPNNPDWRKQDTVVVRIPIHNSFSEEEKNAYYGFRWFSMEPARMRAFATLHYYYHELEHKVPLMLPYDIEEEKLIEILEAVKPYLRLALDLDCLFGDNGIDIYIVNVKPQIEAGIKACDRFLQNIRVGKRSFLPESILLGRMWQAINLMSTCISFYKLFKEKFLFEEER